MGIKQLTTGEEIREEITTKGTVSDLNSIKLLTKACKNSSNKKILVRGFLDSKSKAEHILRAFGDIRILNFTAKQEVLAESASTLIEDYEENILPIVSFYSNLNKCRSIDLSVYLESNDDNLIFAELIKRIKALINPTVFVILGDQASIAKSESFSAEIDFKFVNGKELFESKQVKSLEYFTDYCQKHLLSLTFDKILLHLDVTFFENHWRILLISLKNYIRAIFYNSSVNKDVFGKFFQSFKFEGDCFKLENDKYEFKKELYRKFKSKIVVYNEDFPASLNDLITEHEFLVLDCQAISEIIKQYLSILDINPTSKSKTFKIGTLLGGSKYNFY